jgi:glucose/arabinose dehydrogenase
MRFRVRRRVAAPLLAVALAASLAGCPGQGGDDERGSPASPRSPAAATVTTNPPRAGTGSPPPSPSRRRPTPGPDAVPRVAGVVAGDLDVPWGLAFLPDGSALVSQRDEGTIVRVGRGGQVRRVGEVPGVRAGGEGGLLGITLSPRFTRDRLLYAYLTAVADNRVVRMTYDREGRLGQPHVLVDGIARAGNHNGGRIAFGPDGFLYVATGDAGDPAASQDPESLNGKILRVTADGEPAPGNPTAGSPVWSLGHRNVQGIGWDERARMWASEFGQDRFDELNRIRPGRNYGWPVVEGLGGEPDYVDPVAVWDTDDASPSGIAVVGRAVYLAALRGARLWQVPVPGGRAGRPRDFFVAEYGRLRTIEPAPDGSLWVMTSNTDGRGDPREDDDRILRVVLR